MTVEEQRAADAAWCRADALQRGVAPKQVPYADGDRPPPLVQPQPTVRADNVSVSPSQNKVAKARTQKKKARERYKRNRRHNGLHGNPQQDRWRSQPTREQEAVEDRLDTEQALAWKKGVNGRASPATLDVAPE